MFFIFSTWGHFWQFLYLATGHKVGQKPIFILPSSTGGKMVEDAKKQTVTAYWLETAAKSLERQSVHNNRCGHFVHNGSCQEKAFSVALVQTKTC